ncbi:MAG: hypothetical protein RLZZ488_2655 [Pseudomonadota bacterium]|jgi:hypothetical protein
MKDYSELIDFVSKDTKAAANGRWLKVVLPAVLIAIPLVFIFTSGINEAMSIRDSWEILVMAVLLLAGMIAFAKALFSPLINSTFWFSILAILVSSFVLPQFGDSFMTMQDSTQFWSASFKCFLFGASASALTAGVISAFVYRTGPVPSRATRIALNTVSGISGTMALFFTCPSSDIDHLFAGHGSQYVVLVGLTFLVNEFIVSRLVRSKLGTAAAQFKSFRTFDKN